MPINDEINLRYKIMDASMHKKGKWRQQNICELLRSREQYSIDRIVRARLHATSAFIDRLEREQILNGHTGCVNCLDWSSDGSLLASASDDYHVIIWDPFKGRSLLRLQTRHLANIFSVKFLPGHGDTTMATCAADRCIYVYDIRQQSEPIFSCNCHGLRVKRLATSPDSPHVFWSAGEDGNILQLDIRVPHQCSPADNNVRLISLASYVDASTEAKCLAINPMRTEYLAVGANDPFARIFDRRMLKTTSSHSGGAWSLPESAVAYYTPGHIRQEFSLSDYHESRTITYVTFNSLGTELLVNIGCEHIYIYDLLHDEESTVLSLPQLPPVDKQGQAGLPVTDGVEVIAHEMPASTLLSMAAIDSTRPGSQQSKDGLEKIKNEGNDYLRSKEFLCAIETYSEAIKLHPQAPVFYLNRATALMRRNWFGDVYAALRDCQIALTLNPRYLKAQFRMARAFLELGQQDRARECINDMIERYPDCIDKPEVKMLQKDIKENRKTLGAGSFPNSLMRIRPNDAGDNSVGTAISDNEATLRKNSRDYVERFIGHCNMTTDIKEANYFGQDGNFIVAGSDDGHFYVWERPTGKVRAVYRADNNIVNCVQPHPSICMLATSGIDPNIKIWSPIWPTSTGSRPNYNADYRKNIKENQHKMKTDPFDIRAHNNTFCLNS